MKENFSSRSKTAVANSYDELELGKPKGLMKAVKQNKSEVFSQNGLLGEMNQQQQVDMFAAVVDVCVIKEVVSPRIKLLCMIIFISKRHCQTRLGFGA